MKKFPLFLIAGLLLNVSAFAANGPQNATVDCTKIVGATAPDKAEGGGEVQKDVKPPVKKDSTIVN